METTPRKQSAPGADKRAGRPFRVGDVVAAEEPEQTKPEPTQAPDAPAQSLIAIRYPKPGEVITYGAAEIEEGNHCFKLFAKGVGEAKGQLVAIYNKHTGAVIEAFDPVAVEVSENTNELVYVDDGRPGSVGHWERKREPMPPPPASPNYVEPIKPWPRAPFWSRWFRK
jgi:hypothetical protein